VQEECMEVEEEFVSSHRLPISFISIRIVSM